MTPTFREKFEEAFLKRFDFWNDSAEQAFWAASYALEQAAKEAEKHGHLPTSKTIANNIRTLQKELLK